MQELREKLAASPAPAEAPAEDDDMENLMSALGQESEKVDRLVELLQERGFDPTGVLDEVELHRLACYLLALLYRRASFDFGVAKVAVSGTLLQHGAQLSRSYNHA